MSKMLCPFCDAPDLPTEEQAPEHCPKCFQTLALGDYKFLSLLGAGGMGRVYGAVRKKDNHPVAIKMQALQGIDWKSRELFERSCLVLQNLKHPGLPEVYAFEEGSSGRLFLVREEFSGGTLEERVKQGKRLTQEEFSKILRAMLELLDYLHSLVPPVFHRDIKPSNIMFRTKGDLSPVLVDFDSVAAPGRQRGGMTIVGTPGYTAPEQFSGIITPASDIYSLGMTMIFVAVHADPDDLPRDTEGRLAIKEDLKGLDPQVRRVLLKMVEPERSHRYTSAREVLDDLVSPEAPARKKEPREKEIEFPVAFQSPPPSQGGALTGQLRGHNERKAKSSRENARPEPREKGFAGKRKLSAIEQSVRKHNATQVALAHQEASRRGADPSLSSSGAPRANYNPSPFAVKDATPLKESARPSRFSRVNLFSMIGFLSFLVPVLYLALWKPGASEPSYDTSRAVEAERITEAALKQKGPAEAAPENRVWIPIGESPSKGPADAPVTIIEISDFECPFCGKAAKTVEELMALYPGKIRLVYKHFPITSIHKRADWMHRISIAAGNQGKFWEFYQFLYEHKAHQLTEELVLEEARRQGLDIARFLQDIEDPALAQIIARDQEEVKKAGINATPTFFINGVLRKGALPLSAFREVVEREIRLAEEALRDGVAPERLYEHLSRKDLSR